MGWRTWILGSAAMLVAASASPGQPSPQRADVAAALRAANELRGEFRIRYERGSPAGQRPAEKDRIWITLLQDGQGRERKEAIFPQQHRSVAAIVQVDVWNGELQMQQVYQPAKKDTARHIVQVTDLPVVGKDLDMVLVSLGLRFFHSVRPPAEMLESEQAEVVIREADYEGTPIIEVQFSNMPFSRAATIVHRYDPARQWLLLEQETRTYGGRSTPSPDDDALLFHERLVNSGFEQIDGVWVPTKFEVFTTIRPGRADAQQHHTVTEFTQIDFDPRYSDGDFTVDLASLPLHSEIVDARLAMTYRLGEDAVAIDGRLHRLRQPVTEPIEPEDFALVMAGSKIIADPLYGSPRRTLGDWMRLVGIGLLAVGAAGAVVLFFRHRWSGA